MLARFVVRSLMSVIPEKVAVDLKLSPDSSSPTTVHILNAWLKPLRITRSDYGNLNLQGNETVINIPQHELNPNNEGREIRARDQITVGETDYRVLVATLKTVQTVWECLIRKEMI